MQKRRERKEGPGNSRGEVGKNQTDSRRSNGKKESKDKNKRDRLQRLVGQKMHKRQARGEENVLEVEKREDRKK